LPTEMKRLDNDTHGKTSEELLAGDWDFLTGLFDFRKLQSDLRVALQHSQQISYILVDLDEFKRVNDQYGHDIGDKVLRGVASGFADKCDGNRNCLGPYRRGGESFSVILTNVDPEPAMKFAEMLRAVVEQVRIDSYSNLSVTARLAVVTAVRTNDTGELERYQEGLQSEADKAVYRRPADKKRNGIVHVAWKN
jgi:diguanylate cyclase (GGDEF)-like protein